MHVFKVRDRSTGNFLCGGIGSDNASTSWSKDGKTWSRLSHLKSALNSYSRHNQIPLNWELVVLEPTRYMSLDVVISTSLKEEDVVTHSTEIVNTEV